MANTKWTPELNALVKQRGGLEKGSTEYNIVQNKINKGLGDSTRHDEGINIESKSAQPIATNTPTPPREIEKVELERKNMPKGLKSKGARRDLDAMSSTLASALTGSLKSTGTGNAFKAAQPPTAYIDGDGKMGGISKAEYLKSGGHVNLVKQEDYKPDFDAQALDEGIENRYTDKKALNKAGRSGEISNDEWREGVAQFKETKKADKAQAKRVKDRDKIAAEDKKRQEKDAFAQEWGARKDSGVWRGKGQYKRFKKNNPDLFA